MGSSPPSLQTRLQRTLSYEQGQQFLFRTSGESSQSSASMPKKGQVIAPCDFTAKLCADAIGPLAPSLSWGSGSRIQALHSLCLLGIGIYAIVLPFICPLWLEENIVAQAVQVGNSLEKQKTIFQTSVTALGFLNYACLAMLALACRAVKTQAVSQVVSDTWTNKKARESAVLSFRRNYSISVLMLVTVVLIYASIAYISALPFPVSFVFGWSPAFLPMWDILQVAAFIRLMASLSMNEVEAYYEELQGLGDVCIEQSGTWQVKPGKWLEMLRKHQVLLENLKNISRALSTTILLFQNVVAGSSLLLLWVARACRSEPLSSSAYVLLAFLLLCSGLLAMLPLASITELCQSKKPHRRSLLSLADKYSGWQMSPDVHAEYMRFMQHMHTMPAGMYVPSMGLVTRSSLMQKLMFYVKVLPLALAITLGWWRRG